MKKLLILPVLFFSLFLNAQEYHEASILNAAGLSTDTIINYSVKPIDNYPGRLIEIDFSSINCDLLGLNIGYGTNDLYPTFLDTIPNVELPITLDKTVYTTTFRGVESNVVSIDITPYNGNYLWIEIIDNVACTSGEVKLRYSK
jgi:hypothetical protein